MLSSHSHEPAKTALAVDSVLNPSLDVALHFRSPPLTIKTRDWNEEFQRLVELPQESIEQRQERLIRLQAFVDEFTRAATEVARLIVMEVHLPQNERSIK